MVLAIDISASIDISKHDKALSLVKNQNPDITSVLFFDTKIKHKESILDKCWNKISEALPNISIRGSGGPDLEQVIDYCTQYNEKELWVLTDGYMTPPANLPTDIKVKLFLIDGDVDTGFGEKVIIL